MRMFTITFIFKLEGKVKILPIKDTAPDSAVGRLIAIHNILTEDLQDINIRVGSIIK